MFHFLLICSIVTIVLGGVQRTQPSGRVTGGKDAEIEEFPYQVSMLFDGNHNCGGSILSPTVVLTAGHCASSYATPYLSIRAGSSFEGQGGQVVKVAEVKQHPNYTLWVSGNDAAILILAEPLELGPGVQPIKLVEDNQEIPVGTLCTVAGWGGRIPWRAVDASSSNQLQTAEVPIVSHQECEDAYGEGSITESMICTGYETEGVSACKGDSGGPLVCDGLVAGIISWSRGCSRPKYPNVYGSVANMRGFIRDASGI